MKKPLSVILICSNLILINVLWPMKTKYSSPVHFLYGAFVFSSITLLIYPFISRYKSYISIYTIPSASIHPLFSLIYLGIFTGGYIGYNYSILIYFSQEKFSASLLSIYALACVGSIGTFIAALAVELFNGLRGRFPLLYASEMSLEELMLACVANVTISEFIGVAIGFYAVMIGLLVNGVIVLLGEINYLVFFIGGIVLIASITIGVIFYRMFKPKRTF
jgi:hypothetical protein